MLAFSIDYYGIFFRATQSVGLFCTYLEVNKKVLRFYRLLSCLSFCSLCVGKKHRFRSLFPFGNLPLKRCFLFFIYDLISRSSIRRTAAFLSPLFSEILRPDRTRSGRCRICGCFQDRSNGSGLRTGRRARSKPSTVHPSQSSEVPDRSVCWRGSRLPLPQFFPGG